MLASMVCSPSVKAVVKARLKPPGVIVAVVVGTATPPSRVINAASVVVCG
jgi:hypothetical protein